MSDNVIKFPKNNKNAPQEPQISAEEIEQNLDLMKIYHAQETAAILAPIIFNNLEVAGFPLSDDDDPKELRLGAFMIESLKAMMMNYYGLYHPLHELVDKIFVPDEEYPGALRIVDRLDNVILKKEEGRDPD